MLTGLKHSFADDLTVALQGPNGQAILVLTDAGGWSNFNGTYTFSQGSAALGNGNYGGNNTVIPGGTYGPSVYGFNPIANLLTSGSSLAAFNGINPNGTWKVWLWDDQIANVGSLQSVSLKIAAVPEPATWAMMIGGLALAGLQMRRRATKVSFA
ncbi:PEP-CTERM sorting domain-containing protein [Sphingobium sp. H33]|uniref:PEP-CTERM sorting domain-containing protein n=2 Tax=Sphingobium nicotianae TaxID=2782607 RepID=A0A9X1DDX9_9SPHN|nr:PEP-CTERM sorting domain-containing protein [Sphingobium nicotianae]